MEKSIIYRIYIALARGETYSESELGDTKEFFNKLGELSGELPTVQLNWLENTNFRTEVCASWNLSDSDFFKSMIIPKPSKIENLVYSAELRRIFGVGKLRFLPNFDRDGILILPSGNGFLTPVIVDNLITGFNLNSYGKLKRKAA